MNLYSYVVAYDSGFAPNPFYGFCTLATCKPVIRRCAVVGDWVIGTGSSAQGVNQGRRLVYAMRVSETLTFNKYYSDSRFQKKKPRLIGSRKQARGDNIYRKVRGKWQQLNSYHAHPDGSPNKNHIARDTNTDRVLISDYYVYFGFEGPMVPKEFASNGKGLVHVSRSHRKFSDNNTADSMMINSFIKWLRGLGSFGFISHPYDWDDVSG